MRTGAFFCIVDTIGALDRKILDTYVRYSKFLLGDYVAFGGELPCFSTLTRYCDLDLFTGYNTPVS